MRKKRFLAAILLGVVLCFVVSGVGYGEEMTTEQLRKTMAEQKASDLNLLLLKSEVKYIMKNPNDFLDISCSYYAFEITSVDYYKDMNLPEDFITKDKLFISITDNRGVFSGKSDWDLLRLFRKSLLSFYYSSSVFGVFSYPSDIVAIFYAEGKVPLGYFHQDEYHLWED